MKLSKSKLALAKVINENGGWVDGSGFASQDKVGSDHDGPDVCFYKYEPIFTAGKSMWNSNKPRGCVVSSFKTCVIIKNWHQTILSREEYYQAYPVSDADGWIEWGGGECPVEAGSIVDVRYRDGRENFHVKAMYHDRTGSIKSLSATCWGNINVGSDIVAYRLHKPEVKPEFCESVMRSIPEPEEKPTIEKLAQDYRNKLDFAKRKQQEADDAKAAADAALGELERAGDALGLLIGIAKPDQEPELVITDWRDLQVGDEIECVGYGHPHTIGVVERFDEISVDQNIFVRHQNGDVSWPRLWNFIRRP